MRELTPQLIHSLKHYSKEDLTKDLVSGVIVAIIALPLSIALALASGVAPEQGLYTAIVAGFLISALGGSKVQIAGPTAAFATIVAGIVAKNGMEGLAVATILAGIILVLMGVLRMGSMIKFIPYTITTGFTAGIAVTILIGQLKDFFGLTFTRSPVETLEKVEEVAHTFHTANWTAVGVGVLALAILIVWPRFFQKIPASLIAVVATAGAVKLLSLPVNTIGDLYTISSDLPRLSLPGLSYDTVAAVLPDAFTIAVLAAIESLLSAVVADEMIGSRHNSNMELVAQGGGQRRFRPLWRDSRHRGHRPDGGQHQKRRPVPRRGDGPRRGPAAGAGAAHALRRPDPHALHRRHPVPGGLQHERLAHRGPGGGALPQERRGRAGCHLPAHRGL